MSPDRVTIVEVGPRDGFQPIGPFIPTASKIAFVQRLHAAGIRRMEATAFVSDTAVPQLADAAQVLAASRELAGLDVQVLVPNLRHAERALRAGAEHLAFVLSVSEKHNMNNVRRTTGESVVEYARIVEALPPGVRIRLNLATAFDCPFDGSVDPQSTLKLMEAVLASGPEAEICLCDTTGRVTPEKVSALFAAARGRYPRHTAWAYHGHDTYGLGVANAVAAWQSGIRVIDSSFAGLGGCPFAPGATGNVATEDLVWTFASMGVETGIDLSAIVAVAQDGEVIPGANAGGRVRQALMAAASGHGCGA